MSVVDIRFGKRDSEDHLFIRIGEDWKGDHGIGLIIGHVSQISSRIIVSVSSLDFSILVIWFVQNSR